MKAIIASVVIAAALIGGAIVMASSAGTEDQAQNNNVSIIDGVQVIELSAKGGYSPRITSAQPGIKTVLKVTTKGTFDCSSALSIPDINYRTLLPASGITEIEIPAQASGTTLQGLCSMGMYNFSINFI